MIFPNVPCTMSMCGRSENDLAIDEDLNGLVVMCEDEVLVGVNLARVNKDLRSVFSRLVVSRDR